MQPVLDISAASVFFAGTLSEPQLNHPEGIAVASDGSVWCGGSAGEIYRIAADGSGIELVASTGGFALGVAFDEHDRLYVCDLKHGTVFRLDTRTAALTRFAELGDARPMVSPNVPVVDRARGCLYVSDSNLPHQPGPGVYRLDLSTGAGGLWYEGDLDFANGMTLSADGATLYVVESWGHRISAIPIGAEGAPGQARAVLHEIEGIADGLSLGPDGKLYIACYSPSQIYRADVDGGGLELLIHDPISDVLCHPTNVAWRGHELLTASLGGFNISTIDLTGAA